MGGGLSICETSCTSSKSQSSSSSSSNDPHSDPDPHAAAGIYHPPIPTTSASAYHTFGSLGGSLSATAPSANVEAEAGAATFPQSQSQSQSQSQRASMFVDILSPRRSEFHENLIVGIPETPSSDDRNMASYKYYCPICMNYFKSILKSTCCGNYICLSCCKSYLHSKHMEAASINDIVGNKYLQSVDCPNWYAHYIICYYS